LSLIREIVKTKLILLLVVLLLSFVISLVSLIIAHFLSLISTSIFSVYVSTISGFIAVMASLVALLLPFVMKNIEMTREQDKEKTALRIVLKRIADYFTLPENPQTEGKSPSKTMPFFAALANIDPDRLIKLGIEVETSEDTPRVIERKLMILDKYKVFIIGHTAYLKKGNLYGDFSEYNDIKQVINEMKEHCLKVYKIDL